MALTSPGSLVKIKPSSPPIVSLDQILEMLQNPIDEEQAWALLYQASSSILELGEKLVTCLVTEPGDLLLTNCGLVDYLSFTRRVEEIPNVVSVMAELATTIYTALDYTLPYDQSRELSGELEGLIDTLSQADDLDQCDEGIGVEEEGKELFRLCQWVVGACEDRQESPSQAALHYRQVCRNLIFEARELASLGEVLGRGNVNMDAESEKVAAVWSQVMNEVKGGVCLRRAELLEEVNSKATPRESVLEDIRLKRFSLQPVMVGQRERKVVKTTREEIMESIRSRPPLKPALSRRLSSPRPKDESPQELLMNEIRGTKARQSLKKRRSSLKLSLSKLTLKENMLNRNSASKKVISIDQHFVDSILNLDSLSLNETSIASPTWEEDEPDLTENTHLSTPLREVVSSVKHGSRRDLTLEEVSHIRHQLTRAELEQSSLTIRGRKDCEKGRVCFQCRKTKFHMFSWPTSCQLCRRKVCSSCCHKVKLPSSRLSEVTVSCLRQQLGTSQEFTEPEDGERRSLDGTEKTYKKSFQRKAWQTRSLKLHRSRETVGQDTEDQEVTGGVRRTVCHGCSDLLATILRIRRPVNRAAGKKKSILTLGSCSVAIKRK